MKNKRGFTLVELLAIIVILAVIMVIAVPQILNVVNGSKNGAWKSNVSMIQRGIVKNSKLLNPETGSYDYSIDKICSNPSLLSKVVKVEDTNITCSGNVFTLTGTGQFTGKSATITCTNNKCSIQIKDTEIDYSGFAAGLYDDRGQMLASWDDLVNTYGMRIDEIDNYSDRFYTYEDNKLYCHGLDWEIEECDNGPVDINNVENSSHPIIVFLKNNLWKGTVLKLPDGISKISFMSFYGCANLKQVILPESVVEISNDAFAECTNLRKINLPNGIARIESSAFQGCVNLEELIIPNTVTYIGAAAFENAGPRELEIPASVTNMENSTFIGSRIKKLTVNEGNQIFDSRDDCNCIIRTESNELIASTINTVIPQSVKRLGLSSFEGSLKTSIIIPEGVERIDTSFRNSNITSIRIPSTVTYLSDDIARASKINSLVVVPENSVYDSRNNCNCIIKTNTNTLIAAIDSTIIPSTVKKIGNGAFWNTSKTSIVIPEGVTEIGFMAFIGSQLTSVTLPNTLEVIDMYAFEDSVKLENINIPSRVQTIGGGAFEGCPLTAAVFNNINGWKVREKYCSTCAFQNINSGDLGNSRTAATHLTDTYVEYNWTRSN